MHTTEITYVVQQITDSISLSLNVLKRHIQAMYCVANWEHCVALEMVWNWYQVVAKWITMSKK